jgi:glycosyltransferase involved in cell wall biosynthesis
MISVIVPVYNAAAYLPDLFASLLAQTHAPKEVIFVNDGSKDQSETLIKEFQAHAPFPVRYILQENSGSSASRNRGLAEAKEAYVIFLDSDDLLVPDRIEKDQERFTTNPDLVFGGVELFDQLKNARFAKKRHERNLGIAKSNDFLKETLLRNLFIPPCSATIKTELARAVSGFNSVYAYCEDFAFWLAVFNRNITVDYVDRCTAKYRFGHSSKSSHVERKHHFRIQILNDFFANNPTSNYLSIKNQIYAKITLSTANDFYAAKQFKLFRKYVCEAAKFDYNTLRFKEKKRFLASYFKR